ncbi:hypothetical protein M3O96_15080 [Aquiflexum sp. TKW24L]|uniref:hypothetical protein n=1 Tax=Aquiflexum sp. TKW24L TaxID=2942212 RepID=UPI0020C11BA4|nr:hypothetical protein [Aquiflexum sp. TKW24L]MCL6260424.1 hypothetical protein [Aquiflexum sp. TKW24L]
MMTSNTSWIYMYRRSLIQRWGDQPEMGSHSVSNLKSDLRKNRVDKEKYIETISATN